MRKLPGKLPKKVLLKFVLLPIFFILWIGFPLNTLAESIGCNDTYVQLSDGDDIVINVTATNNDDTENIQCALDVASIAGAPIIRLAAGTYFISLLITEDFDGTLEGRTMASTVIEVLDQSILCDAMGDAGLTPSAIKFMGGEPRIRFMTIRAHQPCDSSTRLQTILHFTGEPADANNCANDVIFGAVDRVILDGTDAATGPIAGVAAHAEGSLLGGCKDTLLGTFKLNRSELFNTAFGIVTLMKAGAQVDINFNEFVDHRTAIYLLDTNQNTTITTNKFFGGSTADFSYFGINVFTAAPDAPTRTRAVIDNNEFNISSSFGNNSYTVSVGQFEPIAKMSSIITNNRFNLSGIDTWGVFLINVDNGHVSTNRFDGFGRGAVFLDGDTPVTGWTITANTGLANFSSDSDADITLGATTSNCIIGPGQGASWINFGSGNSILSAGNVSPTANGATTELSASSKNGLGDIKSNTLRHLEDHKQIQSLWH